MGLYGFQLKQKKTPTGATYKRIMYRPSPGLYKQNIYTRLERRKIYIVFYEIHKSRSYVVIMFILYV